MANSKQTFHRHPNKLSGWIETTGQKAISVNNPKGVILIPVIDVRDGKSYRERAEQIERFSNGVNSKYFGNGDHRKYIRA